MKATQWILHLALTLSFCPAVLWAQGEGDDALPASLRSALSQVPGETLTLDFVVGWAVAKSDGYQLVQAPLLGKEAPKWQSRQLLEWTASATAETRLDESETTSDFSPTKTEATVYGLGMNKAFQTGTALSFNYRTTSTDLDYSPLARQRFGDAFRDAPYFENVFSLNLSQDLWRNAFGRNTQRLLEIGGLGEKLIESKVQEGTSEWALGIIETYYRAWLAKQKLQADRSNLERQRRLLRITNIQARRGTVEEQDVLQIRAAMALAENEMVASSQQLQDIWRKLVLMLNAPAEWLNADAYDVPMSIDNPVPFANQVCGQPGEIAQPSGENAKINSLKTQLKQEELNLEVAKNKFKPDLKLQASLGANGIGDERNQAFEKTNDLDYPNTSVGVTLTVPLSQIEAKASYSEAMAEKTQAELQLRQGITDLQADWLNACNNLFKLIGRRNALSNVVDLQKRRAQLEEEQFRIGRSPAIEVIQAGRDRTQAAVVRSQVIVELHQTAWKLRDMAGKMPEYVKQLQVD